MEKANKRIAKNTLFMYVRLLTTMVVGLYVSRLALEILGVSDYGLFAVVGGVLALFTFISNSLSSATSRFFNTEMGKEGGDVNASFNINLLLHLCLALSSLERGILLSHLSSALLPMRSLRLNMVFDVPKFR